VEWRRSHEEVPFRVLLFFTDDFSRPVQEVLWDSATGRSVPLPGPGTRAFTTSWTTAGSVSNARARRDLDWLPVHDCLIVPCRPFKVRLAHVLENPILQLGSSDAYDARRDP
jgi:hypothetical protein